jgi:hypothetical protein
MNIREKQKLASNMLLVLNNEKVKLQAMKKNPVKNFLTIRKQKKKIQAISEGTRDVLTTGVTSSRGSSEVVDKNNFKTYEAKVKGCYDFYDNTVDYGGEIFGSVADFRCSFIAGEGISFISANKAKTDFIRKFLDENKLSGSRLMLAVRMGEFEGKILWVLAPNKEKDKTVKARLFSWYKNKYTVVKANNDYDLVEKITYKKSEGGKDEEIKSGSFVYLRLGGAGLFSDDAPTKLGKILTQCENVSRAMYDLRNDTHLFQRIFPVFTTQTAQEGAAITRELDAMSWDIGTGYAGTAQVKLIEPTGAAADAILKEVTANMRFISSMSGVPIHWLAYPDLMSNRATAENLLEVVNAATRTERLILEEGVKELIDKACIMAVDAGYDPKVLEGDCTVKIPLISLAALQQLIDVWSPLYDAGHISQFTFRNMLPGIDPDKEQKLIDKEKKDEMKKSPLRNKTLDNSLGMLQNVDSGNQNNTGNEPVV